MITYFAIFGFLVLIGLSAKSRMGRLVATFFVGTFLLIFMGTRYETGCDYWGYLVRFNYLYQDENYLSYLPAEEPGFHLLNFAIKSFGLDYVWLNVSASLIYLICLFRFARISPRPLLLIALFFPILIVQLGMSGLRQALAVGFLLLAFANYTEKNRILTALWILVAAQFHQSAYIFLPLALLVGRNISVGRIMVALILIGPVVGYLLEERAQVYHERYVEELYGENSSSGAIFRYALALIPALLFEKYKVRLRRVFTKSYDLMRLFSLITFALIPVGFVSTVALHRLTYYVLPISIYTLLNVSMVMPRRVGVSKKLLFVPVLIFGAYVVVWFVWSKHASSCYIPYKTYLNI